MEVGGKRENWHLSKHAIKCCRIVLFSTVFFLAGSALPLSLGAASSPGGSKPPSGTGEVPTSLPGGGKRVRPG